MNLTLSCVLEAMTKHGLNPRTPRGAPQASPIRSILSLLGEFLQGIGLGLGMLGALFFGAPLLFAPLLVGIFLFDSGLAIVAAVWIVGCLILAVAGRWLHRADTRGGIDNFAWNLFSLLFIAMGIALGGLIFVFAWILLSVKGSSL